MIRHLSRSPDPLSRPCSHRSRPGAIAAASIFALLGLGSSDVTASEPFRLALPIDCRLGVDCVVQTYVDHDPSPDRRDYMCGHMTSDGQDGIDFRIPSLDAMRRGVMVTAAEDGRVVATRADMPDLVLAQGPLPAGDDECGNSVLVAHADGWTTRYCHMAEGSIVVEPGATVTRGAVLGRVGLSGRTQYPHLRFIVRHDDAAVDPFTPDRPREACGPGRTLWRPEAEKQLDYHSPVVFQAGFIGERLDVAVVDDLGLPPLTAAADQPALVAVTRTIGIEPGDRVTLDLYDPSGKLVARNAPAAFDRPRAQCLLKAGMRRAVGGWMPGRWKATHRVIREGMVVAEKTIAIVMPAP